MELSTDLTAERLRQFLDLTQVSAQEVANLCGTSPKVLLKALSPEGQDQLTVPLLYAILRNFSNLNPMWLLFGIGDMLADWQDVKSWEAKIKAVKDENVRLQGKLEAYQFCLEIYIKQLKDYKTPSPKKAS